MTDSRPSVSAGGLPGPDSQHYPDVAPFGSLHAALQDAANTAGYQLRVDPHRTIGWHCTGAWAEQAPRDANVVMGSRSRIFTIQFSLRQTILAAGSTDDLHAVVGSLHLWLGGATLRELGANWPFVRFGELSEARERGDAAEIAALKWRQMQSSTARHLADLHAFIDAAIEEPRLRALFPTTSHSTLWFSRTTDWPYTRDLPLVTPLGEARYQVRERDGHLHEPTDAAQSVALILAALNTPSEASPN